jgi:catechol 2,3-dioxygenase-like lactoylglutathione lyase family enzyme
MDKEPDEMQPRALGAITVHHVAYTVPDLDEAVEFFTNVLGARLIYREGPISDSKGDWMVRHLNVEAAARAYIAMIRLGSVTNLELFEYVASGQRRSMPRNSDWGGHHLAIRVRDVDAAVSYLRLQPGVEILGGPQTISDGPLQGNRWCYFLTPWGMQMEVLDAPTGMPYERVTRDGPDPRPVKSGEDQVGGAEPGVSEQGVS